MAKNQTPDTPGTDNTHLRSLSSLATGATDEPTRMHARAPIQPVKGRHKGKGKGRPWTNLRALAKEHSLQAMQKIVDLVDCDNPCVALGASRVVVERSDGRVTVTHEHIVKERKPAGKELRVVITRFRKE